MDNQNRNMNKFVKVLCWNIRGINPNQKWVSIKSKIQECSCDLVCLQEMKRESFDQKYIKNIYPSDFDCFDYVPSERNSGGIIIVWKSSRFLGQWIYQNKFALSIELTSTMSGSSWILTNIYAPCTPDGIQEFLS
jgi:exonuclease III